jgi:hypothetical protein
MSRLVMSGRPIVLAAGLVGLFGAGWWSVAAATAASEPQVVHVVADDSSWDTSGTSGLQAGWVSFTLETREGEADHGLALLRLKGEATVDVLVGAEDFDQFLELAEPLGGLVGVTGAATHTMIARLDAGSYAIIDFGESEEGPNFLRGMTASFEVAAGDGSAGVRPHSMARS